MVIGKFKDELGGLVMSIFCGHKSYAFLIDFFKDNDYEKRGIINKKAIGTKKCVIKNKITFNDYVNVLFSGTQNRNIVLEVDFMKDILKISIK